jgi:ribose 5-phosphate isomerase B
MKIALGADHGGFLYKNIISAVLAEKGHEILDLGAFSPEPSDYPDYAKLVAESISEGRAERGILLCGSGVGICVAANKFPGIRACLCHDSYSAHQGVEHDDMNVLCLGERVIGVELAKEIALIFVDARFSGDERHVQRLQKISAIERDIRGIQRDLRISS